MSAAPARPLLDLDALRRFATHADPDVRRWAVGRWIERYPRTDLVGLARGLVDEDDELYRDVAMHLARSGQPRWLPVLTRALELADGRRRAVILQALGALGQAAATDHIAPLLRRPEGGPTLIAAVQALGALRCEDARRALLDLVRKLRNDDAFSAMAVRGLVLQGHHADLGVIVRAWRRWSRSRSSAVERALLDALGVDVVTWRRVSQVAAQGPAAVLGLVQAEPGLPASAVAGLEEAWAAGDPAGFHAAAHAAAVATLVARRDDLQAWMRRAGGEPAEDYRALARTVEGLLGALRVGPVDEEHADAELRLAMGALVALAGREDDAGALRRATDVEEELWRLFRARRPGTAPEVRAGIDALGRRAAQPLAEVLVSDLPDAVIRRATRVVRSLAEVGVEVSACASALVDVVSAHRGEGLAEEAAGALVVIGPAAVGAVVAALEPEGPEELIGALGRIASEEAFQALAERMTSHVFVPPGLFEALADSGDPRAVPLLADAWTPGMPTLASLLLSLCRMHDVVHPDQAAWETDLTDDATGEAALAIARSSTPGEC